MLTLAMNMANTALSQYTEYGYDDLALFQGKPIGLSDYGIDRLEEQSHDGSPIDAYMKTGYMDFGKPNQKRIRSLLLGGEGNDAVQVTIYCNESSSNTTDAIFSETSLRLSGSKAYSVRSQKGRYWQFKIANIDGNKFGIESLQTNIVLLHSKPSGV